MRLQMPLQGAHPKATVRNQLLERSQVTEDHLPKLSGGASMVQKLSATVRNFSTRARRKNLAGLNIDSHAEILRSLRGHEIRLLLVYHNPKDVTK